MSTKQTNIETPADSIITWGEFLASHPPGREVAVKELTKGKGTKVKLQGILQALPGDVLRIPDIKLYCDDNACKRFQFFHCTRSVDIPLINNLSHNEFLTYQCRNCRENSKTFAVSVCWQGEKDGRASKYGEWPPFGPHVPPGVSKLVGTDRELFFKGRRAESQGMGIGAFAYYRRVVENQEGRILDEIIRVAERIEAPREVVAKLKVARKEAQFKKAVKSVKDAIPQTLLIKGRNPLILLHTALSRGLHAESDQENLGLATDIRVILTELAERLAEALKEDTVLDDAVKRLVKSESEKGSKSMPIPMKLSSCSEGFRPPVPMISVQLFRSEPLR